MSSQNDSVWKYVFRLSVGRVRSSVRSFVRTDLVIPLYLMNGLYNLDIKLDGNIQ